MVQLIEFKMHDRIAVIAPHPDDECLGASAALLTAPDRTDIFVVSDGSHGDPAKSIEEEANIRKLQFEAEMDYVKPRSWQWLGYEDTKLAQNPDALDGIDFTVYTKIFMPWIESFHPDHRAAARVCRRVFREQNITAECFSYEVTAPFYRPTHYIDITEIEPEKRKLIRFHEDQLSNGQERITLSLNAYRGALHCRWSEHTYAEAYLQVDAWDMADTMPHS